MQLLSGIILSGTSDRFNCENQTCSEDIKSSIKDDLTHEIKFFVDKIFLVIDQSSRSAGTIWAFINAWPVSGEIGERILLSVNFSRSGIGYGVKKLIEKLFFKTEFID